jgi:hypothetical protein
MFYLGGKVAVRRVFEKEKKEIFEGSGFRVKGLG